VSLSLSPTHAPRVRADAQPHAPTELRRLREILVSLAWRDLRVRYKQSMLGIAWAVLLPVSMMLIFTFVFTRAIDGTRVLNIKLPYALYAFAGLVPWTFLTSSLSGCVNSLVANRNLVTKVYFPREAFPLSCVLVSLVDFSIAAGVLVLLMTYFHMTGAWHFIAGAPLVLLPIVFMLQLAFTIGAGMLLAMGNLFYRDVRQVYGVAIQLLMFVSAVVVPVPGDGSTLARIIALNPLAPLISAYRDCLLYNRWPAAGPLLYAGACSFVVLVFGWFVFRRTSYRFAECI